MGIERHVNNCNPDNECWPECSEIKFADHTEMDCCKVGCGRTVTLDLVHEDEESIGYSGACSSCGAQYNLMHMKGES